MLRDIIKDSIFVRFSYPSLLFLILLPVAAVAISGQQTASRPERGIGGEGSFQTSGIDSISLQNLGVNLHIPLASLPPMAGGKLSFTLQATYNSKLWNISRAEVHRAGPECGQRYSVETVENATGSAGVGWQLGGGYDIFFRLATDDYAYQQPISEQCDGQDFHHMTGRFFKPMLITPDGSERELRIEGNFPTYGNINTSREYLLGYYRWPGGFPGQPEFSSPVRFYTTDGTFITAIYNPISNPLRWTLHMKDGTRVEQSDQGQRTIDTNGNSYLLGFDAVAGHSFAKDEQTGREIRMSAGTHNGQEATKVESQSVGGAWQTTWVVWNWITVKGKEYTTTDWDTTGDQTCLRPEHMSEAQYRVIREIILPETEPGIVRKYTFGYNADTTQAALTLAQAACSQQIPEYNRNASIGWGEVSEVTTPTGAQIKYTYANDGIHGFFGFDPSQNDQINQIVRNGVVSKTIIHDGTTDTTIYGGGGSIPSMSSGGSVTNPDGTDYFEVYFPVDPAYGCCAGGTDGMRGKLVKTVSAGRVLTEKHWTPLGGIVAAIGSRQTVAVNTVLDAEYTTLLAEDGVTRLKMSAKTFQYDFNGELLKTTEYDWFDPGSVTFTNHTHPFYSHLRIPERVPDGAQIRRVTNHSYYNQAPNASSVNSYRTRNLSSVILGKARETNVGNGSIAKSSTRFSYDGFLHGVPPTKGNLTKVSMFNDETGQWIDTATSHTPRGNVLSTTDPKGNVTQFTYDAINGFTDLYPTQTVNAFGTPISRSSTTTYDFHTGLVTIARDDDNDVSVVTSYDNLGRPIKIRDAADTGDESWTRAEYSDSNRRIIVRSDVKTVTDGRAVAIRHYDQLGRVRLSRTLEDPLTEDPLNEHHGIKVETRYGYDDPTPSNPNDPHNTLGAFTLVSSPFRAATSAGATGEPTMGWTRSFNAKTGTHSEVTTFAGASMPSPFGTNTTATGVVKSDIHAERTLVTDQAGKQKISQANALGQLTDVWEITAPDVWTEGVTFPNQSLSAGYRTKYGYDALNNLTTVNQGTQTRTFTYSSLSRLRSASNPESGTVNYDYDPNGNVIKRTDARGIETAYGYDALNRATTRAYSDGTPSVTYGYDDPGVDNSQGQLTSATSSVSTYRYTKYDEMGRAKNATQQIGGRSYTFDYQYNVDGSVKEITYPSLRKVTYSYDNGGRLIGAAGSLGDNATRTYSTAIVYDAANRMVKEQFGTQTPIFNKHFYNSRGQLAEIRASSTYTGSTDKSSDRGAILNHYSNLSGCSGALCNASDNNGNLMRQELLIPNGDKFVQSFEYDALNRLKRANESKNSASNHWQQTYAIDRYGNSKLDPSGTFDSGALFIPDFKIDDTKNRLGVPKKGTGSMTYDATGNLTVDTYATTALLRTYDAENRMTSEKHTNNVIVGSYGYDGDGRRAIRTANGETTWHVYGLGGELLAEYAQNGEPASPKKEYGYRNGQMLVVASAGGGSWGPPPVLSDNPLQVGQTFVRSTHITELRTAINSLRSHMGLAAFAWQQPAAPGDLIRTEPITEMRTALDQALGAPSGGYSPGLTLGSSVRAIHIQELRDRVLGAWNGGSSVQIDWLVADQLGTPRMIIDKTGSVENVRRRDYLPYGERLNTGRETVSGYSSADSVRHEFTGYERDEETDLDYAQARYYASGQGRFASVDPLLASGKVNRPQTWNRYAYVSNNPLSLVDPTGLEESAPAMVDADDPQQGRRHRPLNARKPAETQTTQPRSDQSQPTTQTQNVGADVGGGEGIFRQATQTQNVGADVGGGESIFSTRDPYYSCFRSEMKPAMTKLGDTMIENLATTGAAYTGGLIAGPIGAGTATAIALVKWRVQLGLQDKSFKAAQNVANAKCMIGGRTK